MNFSRLTFAVNIINTSTLLLSNYASRTRAPVAGLDRRLRAFTVKNVIIMQRGRKWERKKKKHNTTQQNKTKQNKKFAIR